MVFFPASIRKNTPAARLSHIDKFLAVFSTLFFLIFRTVSLESGGIRGNMLTRRALRGQPPLLVGILRATEGILRIKNVNPVTLSNRLFTLSELKIFLFFRYTK